MQIKYNLIHKLGSYVITAVHNPKKYPEKPVEIYKPKEKIQQVKVQSAEEQDMLITIMQQSIKQRTKNT